MKESINQPSQYPRCEDKCVIEWVDCIETEDGASICKTREQDCVSECSW